MSVPVGGGDFVQMAPATEQAEFIECRAPATGDLLGHVSVDDAAAVREAVERGRRAQRSWRESSFSLRRRVLRRVLADLIDHADAHCAAIVEDTGKTRENALVGEIWPVCAKLRWTIRKGERHLRPERVSSGVMLHKKARIEHPPRGVVGAIVPWNYPLQNLMNPAIPALMAGNAVVIKPSEAVAWSSGRFAEILRQALAHEGAPVDLVQVVNGYGDTGRALIDAGVDLVVFIGSVPNGRRVLQAAAKQLAPVILELGGKDPFIVCDDADVEQAVHAALAGCFINCGQNCVASERILLHHKIYDAFARRAVELVSRMRQGAPSLDRAIDVGAMVTPAQLAIVERLVADAVSQGAKVLAGGHRLEGPGSFYAPTILGEVTPQMEIMREETFGPVMVLCRVADDDEAIAIANGTPFGLSSSVFSSDAGRARRIAGRIDAGMTAINEFGGATYMAQDLPFGGNKHSGFGRLNGRDGLRAYCNAKAVLDDRWPAKVVNRIYPVGEDSYPLAHSAITALYGPGLGRRLRGLGQALRRLWRRRRPE